jgi:hypothetical protein
MEPNSAGLAVIDVVAAVVVVVGAAAAAEATAEDAEAAAGGDFRNEPMSVAWTSALGGRAAIAAFTTGVSSSLSTSVVAVAVAVAAPPLFTRAGTAGADKGGSAGTCADVKDSTGDASPKSDKSSVSEPSLSFRLCVLLRTLDRLDARAILDDDDDDDDCTAAGG